jgi:flagellar assembly protein FliH
MTIIRKQDTYDDSSKKIILQNLFNSEEHLESDTAASSSTISAHLIKKETTTEGSPIQIKQLRTFESDTQQQAPPPLEELDGAQLMFEESALMQPTSQIEEIITPEPEPVLPTREEILAELDEFKQEKLAEHKAMIDSELIDYKKTQEEALADEQKKTLDSAYEEGYQKGYKEGEEKLSSLAKEALETINALSKERDTLLSHSEKDSLNLGFIIAEKVIQTQLEKNNDVFQNILKEALARITDKDRVIIKVNKKDIDFVRTYKEQFSRELSDIKSLEIQEDADIEIGGCVIETKLGFIDSSITTKLAIIEKAIDKVYLEEKTNLANDTTAPIAIDDNSPQDDISQGLENLDSAIL